MTVAPGRGRRPDLTIVVPTYNEREQIESLLERVFAACERNPIAVEIVIVDDNSADGTGAVADKWASRGPVRVIHRPAKLGLGSAVLDGFAIARSDVVGVMDADLSHPPELLPRLFRTIRRGNFDMVVASRYIRGGGTSAWSLGRRALSRVACALTRPLTPVRDSMSGFFLMRRERLDEFRSSARGFKIGLELIVRSRPRRLAEVGYVFVGRSIGASKMSLGEAAGFIKQLAGLYLHSLTSAIARPRYVALGGPAGMTEPSGVSMAPTDRPGLPPSRASTPSAPPAAASARRGPRSQGRRRMC